jgi:hypothetical protein
MNIGGRIRNLHTGRQFNEGHIIGADEILYQ